MVAIRSLLQIAVLATSINALAMPKGFKRVYVPHEYLEVLSMRATSEVNPAAVSDVVCLDRNA
jgi:hypothetical protein